ncbi:excalibur calcium-binding domain-containing protein [Pseudonocardia nigra]|uniref:excalibur calcium-binding domain-containing protein n=1 Tax=Pseudonocardia nigra TaxID=1921578 RepID=UPI001C5EFA2F|nr:excalibur calcium-binding domain-containing protein [Pseudonocardia nigra]
MLVSRRARVAALVAALTTALCAGLTATAAAQDVNCSAFEFQEDAQAFFDNLPGDPHELDDNDDGVPCESLPRRGTPATTVTPTAEPESESTPETPTTTPPAAPTTTATPTTAAAPADDDVDRDCADFATQADAQAALTSRIGDPERLDADDDGVACEQHFGTEDRQVAVFPLGGVATGGTPVR